MSVTLHYFDCRSRGQALRFALADAGLAFADERVAIGDLAAFRSGAQRPETGGPFAALPVLEWDGYVIAQTLAIASFLAQRLGQQPYCGVAEDRGFHEMVTCAAHLDMQVPYSQLFWLPADCAAATLERSVRALVQTLTVKATQLEALLAGRGGGVYFGGAVPVMSDYFVYESLDRAMSCLGGAFEGRLDACPRLVALHRHMSDRPALRGLRASGAVPYQVTASPSEAALRARVSGLER